MQVLSHLDDSDEEALDLFEKLNPDPSPLHSDNQSERPLGRLTKLKKDAKKEKKRLKRKQKKLQRKMRQMEEGTLGIVTPLKKLKKRKHQEQGSHSEAASHDAGSSEFSSSESENKQDLQNELLNLNPDAAEQDASPPKRLKRSSRKMRIEEKEGFRVDELGNDPQFDLQKAERQYQDEDYSFDDIGRKPRKQRKPKVAVPTNEQIMERFKQQAGVVQSDGEKPEGGYDNGLDTLYSMKDKRKGGIRINNKLFCDIEIDPRSEEAVMPTPQTLELELKPKPSRSSSCFSFLSKVEELKKQRGLQNSADQQEYERRMQQRAKQSLAKVVTSMISQEYHEDIELEVRVPTIARGKSADIINNTVFLKSFARKTESQDSPKPTNHTTQGNLKKEGLTRQQFYRQIQEQTRKRRSKYISEVQLKQSFKKTGLNELEEARKRNQQRRRKEALSEDEEDEDFQQGSQHSKMDELLQKEEVICGDRQEQEIEAEREPQEQQPQHGKEDKGQEKSNPVAAAEDAPQEVQFNVVLPEEEEDELNQEQQMEEQESINEANEIIEELASASHDHNRPESHLQLQEEVQEEEDEEDQEDSAQKAALQEEKMLDQMAAVPEPNPQQQQQLIELEEQGIMLRKRKQPEHRQSKHTQIKHFGPIQSSHQAQEHLSVLQEDKQNAVNLPNIAQEPPIKPHQTLEDQSQEFRNFRKLRKFAMVIAERRKVREQGRRYAAEFLQQQAQEGSDNEDHDDMIKKIDYAAEEKEYEGVDLDADLEELIDNAVDINQEDQQEAFRKYQKDMRIKDNQEIKKIIRGEFRTREHDDELDIDEDERRRQERMEEAMNWMKQREQEDGQGIYLKPPQEERQKLFGSDSQDDYDRPRHTQQEEQDDIDRIPEEEEQAMIERFIENTVSTAKKEFRPTKVFDLGALPQSVKLDKGANSKTIGLSRLASKTSSESQPGKLKKTSSLVNQIMNRTSIPRIAQKVLASKTNKR